MKFGDFEGVVEWEHEAVGRYFGVAQGLDVGVAMGPPLLGSYSKLPSCLMLMTWISSGLGGAWGMRSGPVARSVPSMGLAMVWTLGWGAAARAAWTRCLEAASKEKNEC